MDGHLDTNIPCALPFKPERKVLGFVAAQPFSVSMQVRLLSLK
jgi:hypothetical protein